MNLRGSWQGAIPLPAYLLSCPLSCLLSCLLSRLLTCSLT